MKLLILGNGYLGNAYHRYFRDNSVLAAGHRIRTYKDVAADIRLHGPDVVINCAGKTGRPNIDWCENHKTETLHANVTVPLMIHQACAEAGIRMVHLGTGGIYRGGPCGEEDTPNFIENYYGKTKYLAEQALKDLDVLQLRVMLPVDSVPHPKNLLTKLLSYKETINQHTSITLIPDLVKATGELIAKKAAGIFNVVNPDPVTATEILDIYNQISPRKKEIIEISMRRLHGIVKTPRSVCVLDTGKLNRIGVHMPRTRESLHTCIMDYIKHEERAARLEAPLAVPTA